MIPQVGWHHPLSTNEQDVSNDVTLAIGVPPPLLPKDYKVENFPYFILPGTTLRKTGNDEIDPLIEAYNALGIDIVSMIYQMTT